MAMLNPALPEDVCFVSPNIWPVLADDRSVSMVGGAEVQQSFLIRGLRDAGLRVTVLTKTPRLSDDFELDGIRIVRIDASGREIPIIRNIHPRLTSVWRALAKTNAAVYCQQCASVDTFVTGLYGRSRNRPFIYMGASDPDFQADGVQKKFSRRGGWRAQQFYKLGLWLTDTVVAQHRGQADDWRQWFGREATEIPNGYVAPPGSGASRDGVVFWAATVKSLKRPELFLELARKCPNLRFCMVGGDVPSGEVGGMYSEIKKLANEIPNLDFVGYVPFAEVESYFDRARVFVNTSDFEGFPNTFLQSWARGIPTVSFFDCKAKEAGRSIGFVCKNIDEMAVTVLKLATDNKFWEQEGQRALSYFEAHHSIRQVANSYVQMFDQLRLSKRTA